MCSLKSSEKFLLCVLILGALPCLADNVEYDLVISQKNVKIAGMDAEAMVINGGIPGPILRFTEGDQAIIRILNRMDVETSLHCTVKLL